MRAWCSSTAKGCGPSGLLLINSVSPSSAWRTALAVEGDVISGLPDTDTDGEKVFHAGTRLNGDRVVTNGGRVLCATALGNTVTEAQKRAYELASRIRWDGVFYRKDIGHRAIKR